jgi:cell division protein FtsW (lipid II flippase)
VLPFTLKKFPIFPILGLVMIFVIMFQIDPQIMYSTVVPLISIIILCLILTKRKN